MRKSTIYILLFFLPLLAIAQTAKDAPYNSVIEYLPTQLQLFPHEKIHLHIDRSQYLAGEDIRIKAYLADAASHLFPTGSRYIYIELIDASGLLAKRIMLRPVQGMFYAQLSLPGDVKEGFYTLIAYTKQMNNLGNEYFFRRQISIKNINHNTTGRHEVASNPHHQDYQIDFFPEGGHLVEGIPCNIAFKALNNAGQPEEVSGKIINDQGTEIASLETFHDGMGVLKFTPQPGRSYYADCKNISGQSKRFVLPSARKDASVLSVVKRKNRYTVVRLSALPIQDEMFLLLHCKGNPLFFEAMSPQQSFYPFEGEQLPSGVIQAILFDKEMNPLSERLFFNLNQEEQANLSLQSNKPSYNIRDHVSFNLTFSSPEDTPLVGHFSAAVTDNKDIQPDSSVTILSTMLLSSELRGHIHSPAFYFQQNNPKAEVALDYLMMTHGWRRYNIPQIVKGEIEKPTYNFERSKTISGKIVSRSILRKNESLRSDITLLSLNDGAFLFTDSDEHGIFHFTEMEFPDSTTYVLQALQGVGRNHLRLNIDDESFPTTSALAIPSPPSDKYHTEDGADRLIQKAEERAKFDEEMRVIQLDDIEITGKRIDRQNFKSTFSINADHTVDIEQIEKLNANRVTELFYGIPGVMVNGDGGVTLGNGYPLVMIDGAVLMETEYESEERDLGGGDEKQKIEFMQSEIAQLWKNDSPLERVQVNDVERIEVYRGVGAAAFGVKGSRGVINIVTKKGVSRPVSSSSPMPLYQALTTPLGYTHPAEFYSPQYDTEDKKFNILPDLRTTIYWKPDIVTDENGNARFDFYTADLPSTYTVIIEGQSVQGHFVRAVKTIEVK